MVLGTVMSFCLLIEKQSWLVYPLGPIWSSRFLLYPRAISFFEKLCPAPFPPVSLLMNIQGWFPLGLTGLFSLLSKGLSTVFSSTTIQQNQFFDSQPSLWSNFHIHTWLLEKTVALTIWSFVSKVLYLLFNTLSRFVIALLPSSNHLLISWQQLPSAVIWSPRKCRCFHFFPFHLSSSDGTRCHDLSFLSVEFQASFFTLFHLH